MTGRRRCCLRDLAPGTRFRIPDLGLRGEVVSINPGSVTVRYVREGEGRVRSFTTRDGRAVRFRRPPKQETWSLGTEVVVEENP